MRNILVLQQHSPFNNHHGREALDLVLALAAVEHNVSVLFQGDAVYQLLPTAEHTDFRLKAYTRSFKLFSLYDVEQVYVCKASLSSRGITPEQLAFAVQPLTQDEIANLFTAQHQVVTC